MIPRGIRDQGNKSLFLSLFLAGILLVIPRLEEHLGTRASARAPATGSSLEGNIDKWSWRCRVPLARRLPLATGLQENGGVASLALVSLVASLVMAVAEWEPSYQASEHGLMILFPQTFLICTRIWLIIVRRKVRYESYIGGWWIALRVLKPTISLICGRNLSNSLAKLYYIFFRFLTWFLKKNIVTTRQWWYIAIWERI